MNKTPAYIVIAMSLIALLAMPYGYYTLLRFVVFGIAAYYAYNLYQKDQFTSFWIWPIMFIGIVFNPILPFYQSRDIWAFYNIGTALLFGLFVLNHKR